MPKRVSDVIKIWIHAFSYAGNIHSINNQEYSGKIFLWYPSLSYTWGESKRTKDGGIPTNLILVPSLFLILVFWAWPIAISTRTAALTYLTMSHGKWVVGDKIVTFIFLYSEAQEQKFNYLKGLSEIFYSISSLFFIYYLFYLRVEV